MQNLYVSNKKFCTEADVEEMADLLKSWCKNEREVLIMKRRRYLLIIIAFLVVFLIGCQNEKQNNVPQQSEIKTETRLIEAVASGSVETEGMTKLKEFSVDLDSDNAEEKIELYTAALRNEKGEMLWDDGQNWILLVNDGDKSYPLFSQYVQLGVVYFTVSKSSENPVPNITVIVPTGTGFSMMGYSYAGEKNGFTEEPLYKSKDDNWVYSSIPGY